MKVIVLSPLLVAAASLSIATAAAQQTGSEWYSGIVEPLHDAILPSPVAGILGRFHFKEGDRVAKDQVILELESTRERLDVARQKLIVDAARKDYERTKQLYTSSKGISVSREELDQKTVALKVALAELDIADAELDQRQIRSAFAGVIADFLTRETGEGVKAQDPVVRVVDTSRCVLVCHVPNSAKINKGATVEIKSGSDGAEATAPGRIIFASPVADPSTGLRKVKAEFDNKGGKITPGLTVSMKITGSASKEGQANAN